MILGETWLNQNTGLKCEIDGFECEHVYANKSIKTKKGRYSGGISFHYKSHHKNHTTIVKKSTLGFIWFKIDGKILSDVDLYIYYCYLRDKKPRILRHEDVDLFKIIENDISNYKHHGNSLVTSYLNNRTGVDRQYIVYLEYDMYISSGIDEFIWHDDIPQRVNKEWVMGKLQPFTWAM